MAGGVAEFGEETGVLPLHFAGGGPEVRAGCGGKGEVPRVDADAGEFHGLPGAFPHTNKTGHAFGFQR